MKRFVTLFLLTLSFFQDSAVAQSMQRNSALLNRQLFLPARYYGSGVSFYDVNQDGLDDITIPMVGDSVLCFVSDGIDFHDRRIVPCLGEGKMALWGDYDNDGDPDLFLTVLNDSCKLFRNDGDWNFIDVTNDVGLQNAANQEFFGASWGDYNGDGWLDIFIATYEAGLSKENMLFKNNGGVSFTDVSDVMGVGVDSDYSFQGTFMDFDFDGDQDLHVANDRPPIDAYYINETDYFSNQALAKGLGIYSNSMSSSFADYDHDGDFDFYVTNTADLGNDFWRRNGNGSYSNVASTLNMEMFRFSWGALWIDINNDSWEDLFVNNQAQAGDLPPFFINTLGGFSNQNIIGENFTQWSYSAAKGDFNNDGFYDIITNAHTGYKSEFYKNLGSNINNWVKIDLEGTASNRDGIGTLIKYWVNGNMNIRYTRAGDGYLNQDSQWLILGLGTDNQIDSLELHWLSGQVDYYENIAAGSILQLVEGANDELTLFDVDGNVFTATNIEFCEGDSMVITSNEFSSYLWSNGSTNDTIEITASGSYQLTAFNEFGVPYASHVFEVEVIPFPELSFSVLDPSCDAAVDGVVEINSNTADWCIEGGTFGETSWIYDELSEGTISFVMNHTSGCIYHSGFTLNSPEPIVVDIYGQPVICRDDSTGNIVIENFSGGTAPYDWDITDPAGNNVDNLITFLGYGYLPPQTYDVRFFDANGCEVNVTVEVENVPEIEFVFGAQDLICASSNSGVIYLDQVIYGYDPFFFNLTNIDNPGPPISANDGFWPNLSSGNYLINASDWNSCSTTINISIGEPAELFGELQIDPNNAPNVFVTASGGVPPYQIIGEGEGFDQTQSFNVVAGNYVWILQDANGCQVELEFNMPTSVGELSNLPFQWRMEENEFRILNDQALKMTIYSLDGKLINEVNNASIISLPKVDGVFILRIDEGLGRDWTIKLPIIR
ncbi:MAG: CRTAC1 family protein, partial [Flavobacteriales bacterium]